MVDNFFSKIPHIDLISFLIGLVLGAILYIVFVRLIKLISQFRSANQKTKEKFRINTSVKLIDRYRLDALKRAQSDHLLGSLFPLSDVFVSVPLIYPYPYVDPKSKLVDVFEASSLLPFVADAPEFYESIPFRSKSLVSAIKDHRLLLIQGQIGTGKTTIINNAISCILENNPESSNINGFTPIYAHFSEIDISSNETDEPFQILLDISQFRNLNCARSVLISTFHPIFSEGKAILFIDGLDEAPPSINSEFSRWIESLIKAFPLIKIVLTGNLSFIDGFRKLGFTSFNISPVNVGIRKELHYKLLQLFKILQLFGNQSSTVIPIPEESWQRQNSQRSDIFSLSLELVSEFTISGTTQSTASIIRSYIYRFCTSNTQYDRLTKAAVKMFENPTQLLKKDDLHNILDEVAEPSEIPDVQSQNESYFQFLVKMGFLVERQPGFYGFRFSQIFSYLLSRDFKFKSTADWEHYLFAPIENMALAFSEDKTYLHKWLEQKDFPLFRNIGMLGHHFEKVQKDQVLLNNLLPVLLTSLQKDNLHLSLKLKYLLLILKLGSDSSIKVFEYLFSKSQTEKIFSILGYGFINSTKSISILKQIMISSTPLEKAFCALSLLRLEGPDSRKILLESLDLGDDFYRRLVCEMLSVDKVDGIATLKELSSSSNISIRKSSIFGIKIIDEPWVIDFLTNLSTKDSEWLVRDTAAAALEEISNHLIELNNPTPLAPDKLDWLLEIAGKKGQSISPKVIPNELLMEIVNSGAPQEKLSSLYILSRYANKDVIDFIISLFENDTDLGDQAFFYASEISTQESIT